MKRPCRAGQLIAGPACADVPPVLQGVHRELSAPRERFDASRGAKPAADTPRPQAVKEMLARRVNSDRPPIRREIAR
jgi:hypothetical protein